MKIGYVRVSTEEQNTARQEIIMQELGVERVFIDKMSGKNINRPQLETMFDFVREGDVVIVESISRFARNTRDLLELVDRLNAKSVGFVSQKEAIDTNTPQGKFMLTVFAAMAQLERENILQRQREGIEVAKAAGKYKGRQPIKLSEERQKQFDEMYGDVLKGKCTNAYVMQEMGLKRNTYYKFVEKYKSSHDINK